jgi:hypothetical protein
MLWPATCHRGCFVTVSDLVDLLSALWIESSTLQTQFSTAVALAVNRAVTAWLEDPQPLG